MTTPAAPLARAYDCFRSNRLGEARDLFCDVLATNPHHAGAWHMLGVIAHRAGHHEMACRCLERATELDAFNPVYYSNLGEVYRAAGRRDDAVACCRHALTLRPNLPEAHGNLGVALEEQKDYEAALACYQEAARRQPDEADWHVNIGNVLRALDRRADAAASYREAIRLRPDCADAHHQLAIVLAERGDLKGAEAASQEALRCRPDYPKTYNNLGNTWKGQGRVEEAVRAFRHAIQLDPDNADFHANLADALNRLNKFPEAEESYQEALRLRPEFVAAHHGLGNVRLRRHKLTEAEASLREALRLDPDRLDALNDLGHALMRQMRAAEGATAFRDILKANPQHNVAHSALLFYLNYDPEVGPESLLEEHMRWAQAHAPRIAPALHLNDRDPERPLRVGYVSPDLRGHAVARFFEPVLAGHDPRRVEAFCYAEVPAPDDVTRRMRALARGWRFTNGQSDDSVAEAIREDRIDILVDLAGHTANNRLTMFARRPAPVQVTYLGYPNTTGLAAIDYRLTDEATDPPGGARQYIEELVYLAEGFCCFALPPEAPDVSPLPALRNGHVTFASPHSLAKINGRVLDVWAQVLGAVPDSRLLVFRSGLSGPARDRLAAEFARRGVGADRLELRDVRMAELTERGYLSMYAEADICLDAFPVAAHTTACEALCMGVPLVTLYGDRTWGRLSAAVLGRLGLHDWVTRDPDDYVAVAARQAADLPALAALRAGLRGRLVAGLGDGPRFTRALEDAYRTLWRRWRQGGRR
jgi:predicted O-linked N-acetylglucosamine transferase (SPINDLY family)